MKDHETTNAGSEQARAQELFETVFELAAPERAAHLDRACLVQLHRIKLLAKPF